VTLQDFIQIHFYVQWNHDELAEMIAHPNLFNPEQVEWKRTSIMLFEAMINCHFSKEIKPDAESDEWE